MDHRPLVPILNSYTSDQVNNPRLLRLKEKVAGYVLQAVWRKGKDHAIPDALSRAPCQGMSEEDEMGQEAVRSIAVNVIAANMCEVGLEGPNLKRIAEATKGDQGLHMQDLRAALEAGFPSAWKKRWPGVVPHKKVREELSVVDGLVDDLPDGLNSQPLLFADEVH